MKHKNSHDFLKEILSVQMDQKSVYIKAPVDHFYRVFHCETCCQKERSYWHYILALAMVKQG
jgi:hypothetical protein